MKYQIEDGEIEIALGTADSALVEQFRSLRGQIETSLAGAGKKFTGLARNADGEWVGIFQND